MGPAEPEMPMINQYTKTDIRRGNMKIVVLNGNQRHGSTWHCVDMIKEEISKRTEIEVKEFSLPKDMPHFCNGCFSCFMNGEGTCPHSSAVLPIVEAITGSDLIILMSPVYAMDISGQMKAMLDHLCFMWMSHRPNPSMFNKVGLTVCTTAGAGLGHATSTLRKSLTFWGVKRVYSYKNPVSAMKWAEVKPGKQAKIRKDAAKLAKKLISSVDGIEKAGNPLFRSIFFKLMSGMMRKNTWNLHDREHWHSNGWLDGVKPF